MICASHGSHWCFDYPIKKKKKLDKVLNIEEAAIPAFSVFVGNGCVKHGGANEKESSAVLSDVCDTEGCILTDIVRFSHDSSHGRQEAWLVAPQQGWVEALQQVMRCCGPERKEGCSSRND